MKVSDFDYDLPQSLIANYPSEVRSNSRLMTIQADSGEVQHRVFSELDDLLNPGDLLVCNDTRVIPARLFGSKESGGRFEALIERLLDGNQLLAQLKLSKAAKPGVVLLFDWKNSQAQQGKPPITAKVLGRKEEFYHLQFDEAANLSELLGLIGHIPLPPYINRSEEGIDDERYQTVFAKNEGAVAAPTAGLHFDEELLERLARKNIDQQFITLHVGAGTFQPMRVDSVEEHKMHSEWIHVNAETVAKIKACKENGGRVIAVGTTTVRSLESCALNREFSEFEGETDIFIYPGFDFKVVDAMITNFHLPKTSLLMLVSAFSSKDHVLNAYNEAVAKNYRFFSYGDGMLLYR